MCWRRRRARTAAVDHAHYFLANAMSSPYQIARAPLHNIVLNLTADVNGLAAPARPLTFVVVPIHPALVEVKACSSSYGASLAPVSLSALCSDAAGTGSLGQVVVIRLLV